MAKSYSIVKNRVNNPFQDMEAQKRQVDETGHIQYGYAAPSVLERKPKEQPQPQKNSVMSSILNEVTGATLGDRSLVPASVVAPKSPNAQADYEDARRRLWAYQNDQEAQKAAKERERAYNQAMSEGATGTGATYQDETLARLQREVKDTQQRYESEKTAAHDQYIHDQDSKDLDSMTPEERKTLTSYGNYLKLQRADASSEMGPEPGEEEAVPREYQALVEKYGASRLAELYETASRDAALEQRQQVQQAAQRQSQGAVGGTLASLATIPASVVGGGVALMSRLKDSQNSTGRYKTLSPYTAGDAIDVWADSVKQNVGQQIAGDGSNIFRQGAAVLYQAGLGTVDSVAKAIVLGPAASAATSAMGSYARTLSDASEKGATASQAVLLATANASLDYAMDKIPLDQLAGLAKSGSTSALKAALKQAGIEVTTEGASFLGSQILEMEILQGNSEYARNIQTYMSQGLSQPDATFQANKDLIAQAGQQMLVAGLSGGISAGVSTAVGNRRNRSATEDATTDSPDATAATEDPAAQPAPEPLQEQPLPEPLPQQPSPQPDTAPQAAQPMEAERLAQIRAAQQERDIQRSADEISYQDAKSRAKARKELEQEISKTRSDVDAGKGSPARLRNLQNRLAQMDMEESDYPRTRQEAIRQQADLVDAMSAEQRDAYIRRETGEATNRPNKTATNRLKSAKAELDRLRNMSDADYAAELEGMGLSGNTRAPWLDDAAASLASMGRRASEDPQTRSAQAIVDQIRAASGAQRQPQRPEPVSGLPEASDFLRSRLNQQTQDYNDRMAAARAGDAQPQEKPIATVSRMAEDIGANATARQQQTQENLRSVQDQVAFLTGSADAAPSVGAADRDFTGKAHYEDLLSDDNVKPARRDDFRGDEVPEMDGSQRVSDVAKNLIGSKNTTDAAADQVKDLISSGVFSYDKKTNQQSIREAIDDLNTRGTQAVRDDILHHLARNTIEDGDVAKAVALTNQYIQSGDEAAAKEMMTDLTLLAQKSGRNLQLFSLIRRMSPEGQLDVIQQTADKMLSSNQKVKLTKEERAAARKGQTVRPKQTLVKADIPAELKNQYIEAARSKDSTRIQAATEAIAQAVGAQYHATFKEKWDAWRYMCMLGNASTNVRNVAGNAFMMPYAAAKDKLAAAFEKFLPQEQRTKAFHTDKGLLDWAKEDVKTVDAKNALKYSAKVGADVTQDILSENKQIFKTKALETARKAAEWAPSAGDMLFKNGYYERYLANFLTARGVKRSDIDSGNVSPDLLSQARQYAVDNAYVNTFNDRNNFSDAISSVGKWKASSNPVTRAFGTAIDGILPFRRTPANILVRFKEYSPVEFLSAGKKLKDGKITASEFCNSLATGITGSAAMGLGAALAHGITDSKGNGVRLISKATEEEKLQGKQDYSVEVTVNGKTYSFTVDWAAPANLPLFVGTNLYKAVTENGEDGGDFVDGLIRLADATKDTLEPMLSLSCLSSVNDLLENIKYSEDGSHIYKIAASAATSYLTQGIPSLLRQTGTFLQTEKQTTFANDDRKAVRDVQRPLSNVPFVGNALGLKTDKIDVWGNKVSTGSVGQRAFNAYLNPSKISQVTSDATTRELSRLAATDYGTGVTPEVAAKTLTYTDKQGVAHKDVRLTASQWETYATTKGKTSKSILDSLVKSSDYAKLTDAAKAEVVKLVYSYADKQGAVKAMPDSDGLPETWMEEAQQSKNPGKYIIQKVNNQQMKSALDALTNAWAHNSERPAAVKSLEEAYSAYSKSSSDIRKAVMDAAEGTAKKYLEARSEGLASSSALAILKQVQSIPQADRNKAAYQYQAVAGTKGLTEAQKDTAMKLYMKDGSSTETKYDYIRRELGLSPKEYADAYYAYSYTDTDGDNKTFKPEAIQGIMDLGYSRQEATELYSIYKGSSNAAKKKLADFKESNE